MTIQLAERSLLARLKAFFASDIAWVLLWSAPLWTGMVGRPFNHKATWFADYQAIACAAQRTLDHGKIYDMHLSCPGMNPAVFVYPPWVSDVFAGILSVIGQGGLFWLYTLAFAASGLFLLWAAAIRPVGFATVRERAPFLALIAGSALAGGNVAVLVHASVIATALFCGPASLAFLLVTAALGSIKPIFLGYFAITAFAAVSWTRRILVVGIGGALGAVPVAIFALWGGDLAGQWREVVAFFVLSLTPGSDFLGWLAALQLKLNGFVLAPVYGLYALLVFGGGALLSWREDASKEVRLWIGVTVAALLNPRLLSQDLMILGPGLLAALSLAPRLAPQLSPIAAKRLRTAAFIGCCASLVLTVSGGQLRFGQLIATLIFATILIYLSFQALRQKYPHLASASARAR